MTVNRSAQKDGESRVFDNAMGRTAGGVQKERCGDEGNGERSVVKGRKASVGRPGREREK